MSYDQHLADRIANVLKGKRGITQRKMFGGLCFLLKGNMLCGIAGQKFVARVGPEGYQNALEHQHAKPMTFTGKPLRGMVYVLPSGLKTTASLATWVAKSVEFVQTLPEKKKK